MQPREITELKYRLNTIILECCGAKHYRLTAWVDLIDIVGQFRTALGKTPPERPVEARKVREALIWCCKRVYGLYRDILQKDEKLIKYHAKFECYLGDISRYKHQCLPDQRRKGSPLLATKQLWLNRAYSHYQQAFKVNYHGACTRLAILATDRGDMLSAMCLCAEGALICHRQKQQVSRPLTLLKRCAVMATRSKSAYSGVAGVIAGSQRSISEFLNSDVDRIHTEQHQWKSVAALSAALEQLSCLGIWDDRLHQLPHIIQCMSKIPAFNSAYANMKRKII
ncbi:hypothetical protein B9G98_04271 [Wickerhamiella sorbophila]|uniref:Uncharacterized protein n=1 Tax=Wickerhamiella sorbophila TaxID=45607 RepID=A0A2T0FNT2_9ASCO|nr:hypothetical protein B9G98_04271 [Wickerhamiella sorbophila]PRT56651.1 hypothetical protein B9G98_04271 [Wickerhamiella sorbophila]